MSTTTGIPHRLDAVHRLQGLRGRMQGMERRRRRRLQLDRQFLRQHRRGRPLDLAAREVRRRHAPEPGFGGNDRRSSLRGRFRPTSASIARTPDAWRPVPQAPSCAPSSAASSSSPISAMVARYCVVACPFGVVQRNPDDGRAFKCTFCYDRQKVGLQPACARRVRRSRSSSVRSSEMQIDAAGANGRTAEPRHGRCRASTIRSTPASTAFTRSSSCAAIRDNTTCRRIPRSRPSTQSRVDELRRRRGPSAGRQPVCISWGARKR